MLISTLRRYLASMDYERELVLKAISVGQAVSFYLPISVSTAASKHKSRNNNVLFF